MPTVFLPRGRRFNAALSGARASGVVTAELSAAFVDPRVRAAHRAEIVGMGLVVVLMVLEPF